MTQAAPGLKVYSVPEAAEQLRVSRYWIYDRIKDGTIPFVDLGAEGKRAKYRIRSEDLDVLIQTLTYSNDPQWRGGTPLRSRR